MKTEQVSASIQIEQLQPSFQKKVKNQLVVIRRYAKNSLANISTEENSIKPLFEKILSADTIAELMGYEGNAARMYFQGLAKCIDSDFKFKG